MTDNTTGQAFKKVGKVLAYWTGGLIGALVAGQILYVGLINPKAHNILATAFELYQQSLTAPPTAKILSREEIAAHYPRGYRNKNADPVVH